LVGYCALRLPGATAPLAALAGPIRTVTGKKLESTMKRRLADQLRLGLPERQGLYDPNTEHDSCGVCFVCDIKGRPSRSIIEDAQSMNCCMDHRGGQGYEKNTGDRRASSRA
jgi:Glutamate synthase domain 1